MYQMTQTRQQTAPPSLYPTFIAQSDQTTQKRQQTALFNSKLLDPTDKAFDVMLDNGITLRDDINRIADEFNANKEQLAQQATKTTEPIKNGGLDR